MDSILKGKKHNGAVGKSWMIFAKSLEEVILTSYMLFLRKILLRLNQTILNQELLTRSLISSNISLLCPDLRMKNLCREWLRAGKKGEKETSGEESSEAITTAKKKKKVTWNLFWWMWTFVSENDTDVDRGSDEGELWWS